MNHRILWGMLTVAMTIVWASPADAGRRHQQCRTCSTTTGGGNWFHFTSGGGTYVPFASTTSTTSATYAARPAEVTYGHGYATPARYASPSRCYHCR